MSVHREKEPDSAEHKGATEAVYEKLINSIPGGCGVFHYEAGHFLADMISDGAYRLPFASVRVIDQAQTAGSDQVIYAEDQAAVLAEFRRIEADASGADETGTVEFRVKGTDNRLHWIRLKFCRAYQLDEIQYYYAAFGNIDAQKEAETRLHALQEEYYRTTEQTQKKLAEQEISLLEKDQMLKRLMNINPDSLCSFILNLSRNTCREGYWTSEYIHEKLHSDTADGIFAQAGALIPDADQKEKFFAQLGREKLLAAFAEGESERSVDYLRSGENGEKFWVRTYVNMVRGRYSDDVLAVLYSVNISSEVLQRDMLRVITGQIYYGVALINPERSTIHIVYDRNYTQPEQMSLFDNKDTWTSYQKVVEAQAEQYIEPEYRAEFLQMCALPHIQHELEQNGTWQFAVWEHVPYEEKQHYFQYQYHWLSDKKIDILSMAADITPTYEKQQQELKKEKELRRAAEEANRAKSEFLSQISHDMRTPINVIQGMTRLARKEALSEQLSDDLGRIEASSEFLLGMFNNILNLSELENHETVFHEEPCRLSNFKTYVRTMLLPLCEEKHQKLVIETDGGEELLLLDKGKSESILLNLISNAVKFTPDGGTITCRLKEEKKTEDRIWVTFSIHDTGIGIAPELLPHVFEPFVQGARDDVSLKRGSGLGLAIVKRLVDAMGGTITIESTPGQGTTVTLTGQIRYLPAEQTTKPETGWPELAGRRILVCEDHPLNQEILRALLADQGMLVDIASDGEKGVSRFRGSEEYAYAAVLMDLRMPVLNGYEAAAAIRSLDRRDAASVPILAVTADASEDSIRRAKKAGMNEYLTKPVIPEKLYQLLTECIQTAGRGT